MRLYFAIASILLVALSPVSASKDSGIDSCAPKLSSLVSCCGQESENANHCDMSQCCKAKQDLPDLVFQYSPLTVFATQPPQESAQQAVKLAGARAIKLNSGCDPPALSSRIICARKQSWLL